MKNDINEKNYSNVHEDYNLYLEMLRGISIEYNDYNSDEYIDLTPEEHQQYIQLSVDEFNAYEKGNLKEQDFSLEYIKDLMDKLPYWRMMKEEYCCMGLDQCCWYMPYEEGINDYNHDQVRDYIFGIFEECEELLINESRFYIEKDVDGNVKILLPLRDTEMKYECQIYGSFHETSHLDGTVWYKVN